MSIRAIIWDLGGVLLRTEDYSSRAALAARLGLTRRELEHLIFDGDLGRRAQGGEIEVEELWKAVGERLDLPPEELPALQEAFWDGDRLDVDLVNLVRRQRQSYTTALLSNAFSDLRAVITGHWKIDDAFDEMIISAEVKLMKPDPEIYRLALDRTRVAPSEAVFIDDFQVNVEGARAVGLHAIHFRRPDQAIAELNELLA